MSQNSERISDHAWPRPQQFRRSIRLEFSLYLSFAMIAMMAVTGYIITNQYVTTVTQSVTEKLLIQARSFSSAAGKHLIAGAQPDALMLGDLCKKLAADNRDVYWAGVADGNNTFVAHTDIRQLMAGSRMTPIVTSADTRNRFTHILNEGEQFAMSGDTIMLSVDIVESHIPVGRLSLSASSRQVAEARRRSIVTVASITLFMLLLGVPLTTVLLHRKLRPVGQMTDALKRIDYDNISVDIDLQSRNEFGYLAQTLRVMGSKLNLAQRELVEKERIGRELEIAREIQANILPRKFPESSCFEFSGAYRSAKEVGGDYYDFIEFDDRHMGFLVADVSGKSLPGMLVMLMTRDIVKNHTRSVTDPATLLSAVNRELLLSIKKGMFVTMFFGILDQKTGAFTFASAGHNPLVRLDGESGAFELVKTKGFPLGMMPPKQFDSRLERSQIQLSTDDWLIQYSDGINEALNAEREEFGMDRFGRTLCANAHLHADDLVARIMSDHETFVGAAPQYDDITLVAMKWKGLRTDIREGRVLEGSDVG